MCNIRAHDYNTSPQIADIIKESKPERASECIDLWQLILNFNLCVILIWFVRLKSSDFSGWLLVWNFKILSLFLELPRAASGLQSLERNQRGSLSEANLPALAGIRSSHNQHNQSSQLEPNKLNRGESNGIVGEYSSRIEFACSAISFRTLNVIPPHFTGTFYRNIQRTNSSDTGTLLGNCLSIIDILSLQICKGPNGGWSASLLLTVRVALNRLLEKSPTNKSPGTNRSS